MLNFEKCDFQRFSTVESTHALHRVKFGRNRSNFAQIWRFYGFTNWWPTTSWIFENPNTYLPIRLRDQICVIVLNFIKIGRSVAEIWRFFYFSRWRLSAMLHFKSAILNVLWHKECQCASPCHISSKSVKWLQRYCDFTVFQNDSRRHLGFSKIQILNGQYV